MSLRLDDLRRVGDRFFNAISLVDLAGEDQPLVFVNRAFVELTGYTPSEILGRNCRFLQGQATARDDVALLRQAIAQGQAVFCDLLNYRKDGSTFCNRLVLLPLTLDDRPCYIGMQIDATSLVAPALARGRCFADLKTSDVIRDRINTPLMKIWMALSTDLKPEILDRILNESFTQIVATVRALPFRA